MAAERRWPAALGPALAGLLGPGVAAAQSLDLAGGGSLSGRIVQLVLLLTVLSLAPSILLMLTSFTRIIVVLSLLRSALGLQQSPPNAVLISLSLFLTAFVMAPTLDAVWRQAVEPLIAQRIDEEQALALASEPLRGFMARQVRDKDLRLFEELVAREPAGEAADGAAPPLRALIPAFMLSELRRAFEIGFLLFMPFLVIDMVVAVILMAMGMMMLPPLVVSLPFKLIFFVLVDGWWLVAGSLMRSYAGG